MEILKVSSKSDVKAVAGSIAWSVRKHGCTEIQTIGAAAVNQAVKAVAIARSYLSLSGIELICLPAFLNATLDEKPCTIIKLIVAATSLNEIKGRHK